MSCFLIFVILYITRRLDNSYDRRVTPLALDLPQTASGLENPLNALPNQEKFEKQCPHVASTEVNSDGTREFSNSHRWDKKSPYGAYGPL